MHPNERFTDFVEKLANYDGQKLRAELARDIAELLQAERVIVWLSREPKQMLSSWCYDAAPYHSTFEVRSGEFFLGAQQYSLPLFIPDCERSAPNLLPIAQLLRSKQVRSAALLALKEAGSLIGFVELHFVNKFQRLREEERSLMLQLQALVELTIRSAQNLASDSKTVAPPAQEGFTRLLEYSNTLLFRTDPDFVVSAISGDVTGLLGIEAKALIGADLSVWSKIIDSKDLARLQRRARRVCERPIEFTEEFRVNNLENGKTRWLITRVIPKLSRSGELLGWEGLGFDITEKRLAEDQLIDESIRVQALYEISRSLQLNLDPSMVALHGLRSLLKATESDSGLAFSYNPVADQLELVAAEGVTASYVEEVENRINGPSLVRYGVETRQGILIDDIQKDPRAVIKVAAIEGLRSTIVMPLLIEGRCLGAIVVFCREAARYNSSDFDLVSAAASNIALATYQAELYANERRQASSLAALYRLSHELSQRLSTREISQHAFTVLREELACKRMWLGVINEQGTHVVGQAGFGPGVRRRLTEVQIELTLRHDFLDEAIQTKRPVVVHADSPMECSGLNSIMKRLKIGAFVIVPLVSLGQVVGILAIEPSSASGFFTQSKLSLLTSMGNEIATVLMARRFESRVADADKMRMAGMLASGVAHNFNNLLQAILGQSSLLEMHLAPDSTAGRSVAMIKQATERGATLIRQLLAFSQSDSNTRRRFGVNSFILESQELYRSILGGAIRLELKLDSVDHEIVADYTQLQQVITNLLVNARDAIAAPERGEVTIATTALRLKSGEIDPELAPGEYVRINVQDNGVGMDEERVNRCFEPFFTTKNVDPVTGIGVGGSGLGLSSAYSILRKHEGLISVQSAVGQGSTFSIYIPRVQQLAQHPAADSTVSSSASALVTERQRSVILLGLDDKSAASAKGVFDSLELLSLRVERPEQALELLKGNQETALLLVDADRDGFDLVGFLVQARRANRRVRIIVASDNPARSRRLLSDIDYADMLDKPIGGGWMLHQIAGRALRQRLSDQIEVEYSDERSEPEPAPFLSSDSNKKGSKDDPL